MGSQGFGVVGMAQGGGRGWFHRKRHQPSDDRSAAAGPVHVNGTTAPPTTPVPAPWPDPSAPTAAASVASPVVREHLEWTPEPRQPSAPPSALDPVSAVTTP